MSSTEENKSDAPVGSGPFMRARLETSRGDHVTFVKVPPFVTKPEVLLWGGRIFALARNYDAAEPVYREAFAYAVPGESEA